MARGLPNMLLTILLRNQLVFLPAYFRIGVFKRTCPLPRCSRSKAGRLLAGHGRHSVLRFL
ncbi:hypothetical protein IG631_05865 [Alternaria alternata]|nr:hypothetical protein IG631_05865 [Alternaria alternata]